MQAEISPFPPKLITIGNANEKFGNIFNRKGNNVHSNVLINNTPLKKSWINLRTIKTIWINKMPVPLS